MNKVILMGRLTRDPEVRYSQNEQATAVARYTLAVDRRFKKEGEEQTADFINQNRCNRPHPDGKLYEQGWSESLYDGYCRRRSGICGE